MQSKDFVASLEHGLAVMEAFDATHPRMTLSEVAARTGLTRAAARRYLLTLAKLGYADYDGKHFRPALRVMRLGYSLLSTSPLPLMAQSILDELARETGEVTSLAVLDEREVVFLARSQSQRVLMPTIGVGTRLPVHSSASGRAILSQKSDAEVQLLLGHLPIAAWTPKTELDPRAILRHVQRARRLGYAISEEELELGVTGLSIPVPSLRERHRIALTVSTSVFRMGTEEMIERFLPPLRDGRDLLAPML
ncbi:IclR family transcriptional regulator [Pigmentiphaga soli]|uniref:IclR family transcriptional regulator n=1 Tax=Pigmentiphaga soli TaxID=1007095 RepID=A0ABP8H7K3_9BURK